MTLSSTDRVLGVQRVCSHFVRNLACFRAARNAEKKRTTPDTRFWKLIDIGFANEAVLDWCKLLGDKPSWLQKKKKGRRPKNNYGWEYLAKMMGEKPVEFRAALLEHLEMAEDEFEKHRVKVRNFRNKFVAHLDDGPNPIVPQFDVPLKAIYFLFDRVTTWAHRNRLAVFGPGIQAEYEDCFEHAKAEYAKAG